MQQAYFIQKHVTFENKANAYSKVKVKLSLRLTKNHAIKS